MSMIVKGQKPRKIILESQSGVASILITMITMIVISLIVLGFANISRSERNQTLDRQLSMQSLYAAESGVEDARRVIYNANGVPTYAAVPGKTACTTNTDTGYKNSPNYPVPTKKFATSPTTIDPIHNVSYSCLLVDPNPTILSYNGVGDSAIVVPMNVTEDVDTFTITWSPTNVPASSPKVDCPTSTMKTFSPATGLGHWTCGYGLLAINLVPTSGYDITRDLLKKYNLTSFFEPVNPPGAVTGNIAWSTNLDRTNVVAAKCDTNSYTTCTAVISGLPNYAGRGMTMRMMSLYQASNVKITAQANGFGVGNNLPINGAQTLIDVTGNANGVLRRIQVWLPVNNYGIKVPDYGIETNGGLCKRFSVTPGYFDISDIVPQNQDPSNPMCHVPTNSGTPKSGG